MIFLDTETTGLLKPGIDADQQPKVIEIAMVKAKFKKGKFKVENTFEQLIDPGEALEPVITKITGITDAMLTGRPTYTEVHDSVVDFFLGERIVVAHNAPFDMGIMWAAAARIGLEFHFPWPPVWQCTAEESKKISGRRLKLRDLHEYATGKKHDEHAHRAMADVEATMRCYKWMIGEGYFK